MLRRVPITNSSESSIGREVYLHLEWKNMNILGKSERMGMHASIYNFNIWSFKINFLLKSLNEVMDGKTVCKERQDETRNSDYEYSR